MKTSAEKCNGRSAARGSCPQETAYPGERAVPPAAASEMAPEDTLIAIIDDDALVAQTIGSLVESLGHRAVVFNAAGPFLRSEAVKKSACLITDLQMPGLNGLELQKELQSRGYRRPFIVVSGHSDEETRSRALSAGAAGFLRKPFDTQALVACLDAAITLSSSQA